jgi:hypothetical protein
LRVDEDVDLSTLVRGQRLGQLHRWSASAHGFRVQPCGAELLREVVRVVDAGGVDDARRRVEAVSVQAGGGVVQRLVVEGSRQGAFLEVPTDDRHGVDRRHRWHPQIPERRDQTTPRRLLERQVVDRRREHVGHLLGDQLLGCCHADVDGIREAADRGARLLAERRVRLIADHELVRVARQLANVACEPGVRLDRDGVRRRRPPAARHCGDDPVAVALRAEFSVELRDEEAAVREDEHAERAGGLDEAGRGDGLARGRRVAEPEAPNRPGICGDLLLDRADLALVSCPVVVRVVVFLVVLGEDAVLELLGLGLVGGNQLGQHPGERVHLVAAQLRAGHQARWPFAQDALEPEHEPVAHAPAL